MKKLSFCFLILASGLFFGFIPETDKDMALLEANVINCGGEISLYKFDGVGFKFLESTKVQEGDLYTFSLERGSARVLYLGKEKGQKLPLVVGPEEHLILESNCINIRNAVWKKSDLNIEYNKVISAIKNQKARHKQLMRQVQKSKRFPEMLEASKKAVAEHDIEKGIYIDSIKGVDPFLGKLAAINSYQSFISDPKGYPNELAHFGMEFFTGIDLEDPAYDELTFLFEAFREYASTFGQLGVEKDLVQTFFDHSLKRIDPSRPAYKNALGGLVLGLQSSQHPAYLIYGKKFLEKYRSEGQPYVLALESSLKSAEALLEGGEAPELTGQDPQGNTHNLSDLRGKYVLIDFWASWCGPCRRENPAVVKLYEKYRDQGFEIFGVSLDRDRLRWIKAIEQDGLTWNHISDLKGWQSQHASLYGVRSIPTTILLDKKGKVLKRRLRAHDLEIELEKLFSK